MTPDDFRTLALTIPLADEQSHMGHPDFRLSDRIFASLGHPDDAWGMVKLTPDQQREFVAKAPDAFRPCDGAWGRSGCTNVHLASVQPVDLRAALAAAAGNLIAGPPAKSRRRPSS